MDSKNSFLTTPTAVILGSVIIASAILISNGSIKLYTATQPTPTPNKQAQAANNDQPQAKTEVNITNNLKQQAGKIGLDQQKFNSCLDSGSKASLVKADLDDGTKYGVQGTPAMFINGIPIFKGAAPFSEYKKDIDAALAGTAATTDKKDVPVGNLPVLGNINAPVTIIQFSDYQCPYCAKLYSDAEAQIKKEYVDTGKVKIYFRDYPLSQIHQGAEKAAEAARCAGDQGKYWQMHDAIFQYQSEIF